MAKKKNLTPEEHAEALDKKRAERKTLDDVDSYEIVKWLKANKRLRWGPDKIPLEEFLKKAQDELVDDLPKNYVLTLEDLQVRAHKFGIKGIFLYYEVTKESAGKWSKDRIRHLADAQLRIAKYLNTPVAQRPAKLVLPNIKDIERIRSGELPNRFDAPDSDTNGS